METDIIVIIIKLVIIFILPIPAIYTYRRMTRAIRKKIQALKAKLEAAPVYADHRGKSFRPPMEHQYTQRYKNTTDDTTPGPLMTIKSRIFSNILTGLLFILWGLLSFIAIANMDSMLEVFIAGIWGSICVFFGLKSFYDIFAENLDFYTDRLTLGRLFRKKVLLYDEISKVNYTDIQFSALLGNILKLNFSKIGFLSRLKVDICKITTDSGKTYNLTSLEYADLKSKLDFWQSNMA